MASAGAIALTGSAAMAADLAPPPVFTWTGVYLGGQVGYAWGTDNESLFANNATKFFSGTLDSNPQGVIGGAHAGYNLQINQWVLGLEGSVDGTSLTKTVAPTFSGNIPAVTSISEESSSDIQGSVRGRLGVAFDRVLLYATGGVAFGGFNTNFANGSKLAFLPVGATSSFSNTRVGWTVGGGIEYALTNNWLVRAEYRYTDFGRFADAPFKDSFTLGWVATTSHRITQNQVEAGFSYKFDFFAPPPVVAKY
ncbi:MAG: outer membrane protein [Methylocella sp.]